MTNLLAGYITPHLHLKKTEFKGISQWPKITQLEAEELNLNSHVLNLVYPSFLS